MEAGTEAAAAGRQSARERILDTAYALFSRHGTRAVGVDRIIAECGIAKMTLYRNFPSKDELILAFLDRRAERWTHEWLECEAGRGGSPAQCLLALFDTFDGWFRQEDFEGCSFINVMLEIVEPESPVRQASVRHLESIRAFLRGLAEEAGIDDPDAFARQWHILMKGSIVAAAEGDREAAQRAKQIGRLLLEHNGVDAAASRRRPRSVAPDLRRRLDDQAQLRPLLLLGDRVALDRRGEPALRREAELVEIDVLRRLLDAALELVLRLELAALRRDQPEHDDLALRHEAQRLESARALVVPLHEEAVDGELAEQRLGDEVVAALGHPGRAEVAAAHVRRDRHVVGAVLERLVDVADVELVLVLGVAAETRDHLALLGVVEVGEARVVELQVRAPAVRERADLGGVRARQVAPEAVHVGVDVLVDRGAPAAVV